MFEFRTDERQGTQTNSCKSFGSSKIRYFQHSTEHVDKNVCTLDVTMNNLVVVLAKIDNQKSLVLQQLKNTQDGSRKMGHWLY